MSEIKKCENMINGQLRICDITNENLIKAIRSIKRTIFVPNEFKNSSYIEYPIPLIENQQMMTPITIGKILQSLNIKKNEVVLQIGSGSGYLTALLAKLSKHVDVYEYFESLAQLTIKNLKKANILNAKVRVEDCSFGIKSNNKYDCIIITPSMPKLIERYLENLNPGGKLIAILGDAPNMKVNLIKKLEHKKYVRTILFETVVPKMVEKKVLDKFKFN